VAGFCATSCCKARRDSQFKSLADTVLVANNVTAASIREIWVCRIGFIVKLIYLHRLSAILLCLLRCVYRTLGLCTADRPLFYERDLP